MRVLGLSYGFHDSAAALIIDGQIVAAAQQERFSRIKNDAAFPGQAARWCLDMAGVSACDLDLVAYHEMPMLKFDRITACRNADPLASEPEFKRTVARWLREERFDVRRTITKQLGVDANRIAFCRHHQSHAASAFYCSPFERAAVVTLDGVGEYETATISVAEGDAMRHLSAVELPHSIGLFYSAFTAYLGFPVNEGEYKVMGMAAYGVPRHLERLRAMFKLFEDGTFELDQSFFSFNGTSSIPYTPIMTDMFGPPRIPSAPFVLESVRDQIGMQQAATPETLAECQRYADIAASLQACTEEIVSHVITSAARRAGTSNVAIAGGVALNSLANGRILRETDLNLFVQPAAGDAGCALGAALYHWHNTLGGARIAPQTSCALGRGFAREACNEAARSSGFSIELDTDDEDELLSAIVERLVSGQVMGWCQGRAEWGPRALGQRSILADPRRPDMQLKINKAVKFREPFRPFAPAVAVEHAGTYFDLQGARARRAFGRGSPEQFMLAVHPVRPEYRDALPAITHVDGTARVQIVCPDDQPLFHELLTRFAQRTGIPILLNTSFNLNGEPIVDTPADAVRTFSLSNIDALAVGGILLSKRLQNRL